MRIFFLCLLACGLARADTRITLKRPSNAPPVSWAAAYVEAGGFHLMGGLGFSLRTPALSREGFDAGLAINGGIGGAATFAASGSLLVGADGSYGELSVGGGWGGSAQSAGVGVGYRRARGPGSLFFRVLLMGMVAYTDGDDGETRPWATFSVGLCF